VSIVQTVYKSISCNGPGCPQSVTFEDKEGAMQRVANETPWFKTLRMVQTAQGRNFCYCSDSCELESIAEGNHNPEERKSILIPEGANAQQLAAAQAKQAEEAAKAIKKGSGLSLV
jgi:hypothetical protein